MKKEYQKAEIKVYEMSLEAVVLLGSEEQPETYDFDNDDPYDQSKHVIV